MASTVSGVKRRKVAAKVDGLKTNGEVPKVNSVIMEFDGEETIFWNIYGDLDDFQEKILEDVTRGRGGDEAVMSVQYMLGAYPESECYLSDDEDSDDEGEGEKREPKLVAWAERAKPHVFAPQRVRRMIPDDMAHDAGNECEDECENGEPVPASFPSYPVKLFYLNTAK